MRSNYASEMPVNDYKARARSTHKRSARRWYATFMLLIITAFVILGLYLVYIFLNHSTISSSTSPIDSVLYVNNAIQLPVYQIDSNLRINSTNAVLVDFENGDVLFDRGSTERIYPASMVKIMTALVVIEHIENLNERVLLRDAIFQPIHNANAVTAGFLPGESVRAIDLLYGLLLPSGAECAVGLAEFVAGSENAFVELMNEKARDIGLTNSNFTNSTGLHSSNQYSTVIDIALLLQYALRNDVFYQIVTSPRHSTAPTSLRDGGITFHSTLFARIASPEFNDGRILGGRTGFTNEAGQSLASFAEIDGRRYILVTSGADPQGNHLTQTFHIDDAFTIYAAIDR